jgi:four helix bundle protein
MANLIQQKSFDFALRIIKLYSGLQQQREYVLSRQLLRSGTSIGANVTEGQSRKDFLSKMSIASKEARETKYWCCCSTNRDSPNWTFRVSYAMLKSSFVY